LGSLLSEAGFLEATARPKPMETGSELIQRLGRVGLEFSALPWPETPRMTAARDRWRMEFSEDRHLLLTALAVLAAIGEWGSGAQRFLKLVQASRAIDALLPDGKASVEIPDGVKGVFEPEPSLPPDALEFERLSAGAPSEPAKRRTFVWWKIAAVATTWVPSTDETRRVDRLPRKLRRELPEDVIVGWADVLERLLEEEASLR